MTPAELDQVWVALPEATSGQFSGTRVPGLPPRSPIYVATDTQRRRQLLVAVPVGSEPLRQRGTRGLDVLTENLQVGSSAERTYIRLTCLHPAHQTTFAALCSDVIVTVGVDPVDPRSAVVRCLERWRAFWARDGEGLTREEALGLFGELWFLYRWMAPMTFARMQRWQGPRGARHDFQWPQASVEVKAAASASAAAPVHHISNLDQLAAPEVGQLYLFSLHVADDALAANSLPSLVQQVAETLREDEATSALLTEQLALVGYNPAHADRYSRTFRIISQELYLVDNGFPRLTRLTFTSGLPPGVGNVSYCLDMAACATWRVAATPSATATDFLRS